MTRLLVAPALVLLAASAAPAQPARFGWHTDYQSARAEARRTGKPIFLVFRCEP
jgi:hypothetical protein